MPNYISTIETLDKYAIGSPLIHIHYPVYDQTLSLWVLVAKICEHATVQTFWWLLYHCKLWYLYVTEYRGICFTIVQKKTFQ